MSHDKHIRNLRQDSEKMEEVRRERLLKFRKEKTTKRVKHPTKPDVAKKKGYKAKQGFIIVRQRVKRGGRQKRQQKAGRKSSNAGRYLSLNKNYQSVAEEKASREYPNLTVLNSYKVLEDGQHAWFEIILIDKEHPNIESDTDLKNLAEKSGRVERGLTSSGRKSRGLRNKGKGSEKKR